MSSLYLVNLVKSYRWEVTGKVISIICKEVKANRDKCYGRVCVEETAYRK